MDKWTNSQILALARLANHQSGLGTMDSRESGWRADTKNNMLIYSVPLAIFQILCDSDLPLR